MNVRKLIGIIIIILSLLFLIIGLVLVANYRAKRIGMTCIFDNAIKYRMTITELENLWGKPDKRVERSDGSIVLHYNIPTSYAEPVEANFVFRKGNHKLYKIHVRIRLDTAQEASTLLQQLRSDIINEYDGSLFFFDRQASLDGEVIGVDYLGVCQNFVELTIENGTTIILSGQFS